MKEIASAFALNAKVAQTLRAAPADPNANLAQGRFVAFVKGDWQSGLPILARGNDAGLKSLAEAELARPTDASRQAALGDGWYRAHR